MQNQNIPEPNSGKSLADAMNDDAVDIMANPARFLQIEKEESERLDRGIAAIASTPTDLHRLAAANFVAAIDFPVENVAEVFDLLDATAAWLATGTRTGVAAPGTAQAGPGTDAGPSVW